MKTPRLVKPFHIPSGVRCSDKLIVDGREGTVRWCGKALEGDDVEYRSVELVFDDKTTRTFFGLFPVAEQLGRNDEVLPFNHISS
jgi:hypothetical protein